MKKTKLVEIIILLVICTIPLIAVSGCGGVSCVRCTNCGDDDTRMFVYASGEQNGVKYTSCAGPAGCTGIGLNSVCWPTECEKIETSRDGNSKISGCVYQYHATGCINKAEEKSKGTYNDEVTCMGISCAGKKYVEITAETTKAYESTTCLGVSCGEEVSVKNRNYNKNVPRSFRKGCWTNDRETEER